MIHTEQSVVRTTAEDDDGEPLTPTVHEAPAETPAPSQPTAATASSAAAASAVSAGALTDPFSLAPVAHRPQKLVAGSRIGDYEVLEEVARGGMGVVCRARQRKLDREVALKVMLSGAFASDVEVGRFLREAQAAARLQHPAICRVHETGVEDGHYFYTMDFVKGTSLAKHVRAAKLSLAQVLPIFVKVCDGVHYAHMRGVIHRDLKPANVLVDERGEPRITDFGIAKLVDGGEADELTMSGVILGTPNYMPPEQAAGKPDEIDIRADVYALGAILYELACGEPPFRGGSQAEVIQRIFHEDPEPLRKRVPDLPWDVEMVVSKCLAKVKDHRYQSALELREDVERILANEPIRARRAPLAFRAGKWLRRHPALVAGGLTALSALSIGAAVTVSRHAALRQAAATSREEARGLEGAARRALEEYEKGGGSERPIAEARALLEAEAEARLAKALSALREASTLAPGDTDLAAGAARVEGELAGVRGALERAVAREAEREGARRRAEEAIGLVAEGRRRVAEAEPLALGDEQAVAAAKRSLEDAERACSQALDRDPRVEGGAALIEALALAKSRVAARQARFDANFRARTLRSEAERALADAADAAGRGDLVAARDSAAHAVARFDRALDEDPENAELRRSRFDAAVALAACAGKLGEHDLALFVLEQAAKDDPARAKTEIEKAQKAGLDSAAVARAWADGEKARIAARRSTEIDRSALAAAAADYREALRLDPACREARFGLAFCEAAVKESEGKDDAALAAYEAARDAAPDWRMRDDAASAAAAVANRVYERAILAARAALAEGGASALERASRAANDALRARPADNAARRLLADIDAKRRAPEGMVYIPGGPVRIGEGAEAREVACASFYIGATEVTNEDFARFLRADGYETERFWDKEGWAARGAFRDTTGAAGPAGWSRGAFPPGAAREPVAGVSWYEARAFARFAGSRLPTEVEWEKAALFDPATARVVPEPWRAAEGRAPAEVAALGAAFAAYLKSGAPKRAGAPIGQDPRGEPIFDRSPAGVLDMYGNVHEWTADPDDKGGFRLALRGGSFLSVFPERALAARRHAAEPLLRSPAAGFRLAHSEEAR